jgi:hypothetical protein
VLLLSYYEEFSPCCIFCFFYSFSPAVSILSSSLVKKSLNLFNFPINLSAYSLTSEFESSNSFLKTLKHTFLNALRAFVFYCLLSRYFSTICIVYYFIGGALSCKPSFISSITSSKPTENHIFSIHVFVSSIIYVFLSLNLPITRTKSYFTAPEKLFLILLHKLPTSFIAHNYTFALLSPKSLFIILTTG